MAGKLTSALLFFGRKSAVFIVKINPPTLHLPVI
jgi:hypothetical protein